MAIPSVNASAENFANVSSTCDVSITITSGTGRVLIGFALNFDSDPVTYSSVVFDPAGSDEASFTNETSSNTTWTDAGGGDQRAETWYLVLGDGVASGAYTVRFTAGASVTRQRCIVLETDANTTDPIGASGTGGGNSATEPNADVTTTAANSLVVGAMHHRDNITNTAGSGDTEIIEGAANNNTSWAGYTPAASTGTYNLSCTVDSGTVEYAFTAVELLEAAGGGTVVKDIIGAGIIPFER